MRNSRYLFCTLLFIQFHAPAGAADGQADPESEIRQVGSQYVEAFNSRDSKTLAGFWSPEAVYTNRLTGEQTVGREMIAKEFDAIFEAEKELKIKVDVDAIQFVSPNVAIENGVTTFIVSDSEPESINYSAVYVRRDGKWLLDRVTDEPKPVSRSNYEELKALEWMVGTWTDEADAGQVVTECKWTKNQNFLTRSFQVSIGDRVDLSGIQFIGWDAQEKRIRSWTFDSDGGYAEGQWSNKNDRWFIRKKGTTSEGETVTAVNIVSIVDEDAFTVKSTQRTVAGELLPNLEEVMVVRR